MLFYRLTLLFKDGETLVIERASQETIVTILRSKQDELAGLSMVPLEPKQEGPNALLVS